MLAGPMVETMESVKLYQSYEKRRVKDHNQQLLVAGRVQGKAEHGSRMQEYHHVYADDSQSESGTIQRCSPLLAAVLMAFIVRSGIWAHNIQHKHTHYLLRHPLKKGTI